MFKFIDDFLNRTTMYRLVLYYLIGLLFSALVFSFFHILPYNPVGLIYSTLFLLLACYIVNAISAWLFGIPANVESVYITALILALIITPLKIWSAYYLIFLAWAGALAMASKYILAINRKHFFNPAALAVAITALAINRSASWWIGTSSMLPLVLMGGVLVVRKLKRWPLVLSFFGAALITTFIFNLINNSALTHSFEAILFNTSLFFFAFVMLTEPLTTPPTRGLQMVYGGLVGFLFVPQIHLFGIYATPELALLAGNIFSYAVSPKSKYMLELLKVRRWGSSIRDFVFAPERPLKFKPGQYLEWTLGREKSDNRGNRRYFTIASSPTEPAVILGAKFYTPASSFKSALLNMRPGDKLLAGQLAGDFTLPKNPKAKLAFIAGGIGITPFRSMLKYLADKNQRRDVVLFYSSRALTDIAYTDVFDEAADKSGAKVVYALSDAEKAPQGWQGELGDVTMEMIIKHAPDFRQRIFYLSGPRAMVNAFQKILSQMGVNRGQIKTDYFPGFA